MKHISLLLFLFLIFSCSKEESYTLSDNYSKERQTVIIKTSLGDLEAELFNELTPQTILNFVELAEGKKQYIDPKTRKKTKGHFYDNTIFHRVINNFMIQGGDPTGTGRGGPGYTFNDEITPLNKNERGTLSMANRGRNTNGSQFFINLVNNTHLNRGHTVFGKIIKGMDVIDKIAQVQTDRSDKPLEVIIIKSIRLKK